MTTNIGGTEYLSSPEVARLLGIRPSTFQVQRSRARVSGQDHPPYISLTRHTLYPVAGVHAYIRRGGGS